MADSFDPYHAWLGISPANQPPNHYRLLGIELFEQSGDVIDAAASRQSMMLRDFTSGEHDKLAERLLDEVKVARVNLLNPQEKAKYDQKLRSELTDAGEKHPEVTGQDRDGEASPGYHLWLGITPALQPPTHYRLLGLDPFETSVAVIEAGADRQSGYLREVAVGKQRKQSQSLLNEVSAARRCLLDPEKRKAYDEQLRAEAEKASEPTEQIAEPEQQAESPQPQPAVASAPETPKPNVAEVSAPSPQKKLKDSPKADASPPAEPAKADDKQPAPEAAASTKSNKTPSPEATKSPIPAKAQTEKTSPESEDDARRKMLIIIGSVAAAVLVIGTGLFFWLSDPDAPASPKTAGSNPTANGNRNSGGDEHDEVTKGSSNELTPPDTDASNEFDQLLAASKVAGSTAKPAGNATKPQDKPTPKPGNSKAGARSARVRAAVAARAAAAKKAAAPKPPPFRKVLLPNLENNVSSVFWKNVNGDLGKLAITPPTSRAVYRRLNNLAGGEKERLGPKAFQKVRGLLIPPVDGQYQFHIKSVGPARLLLGEGQGAYSKKQVKDGQTVDLSGSQTYYFELLHLDPSGKGSFSVGWTLPDKTKEHPIPGGRLAWTPFLTNFASLPISSVSSSENLKVERVKDSDLLLASATSRDESTVTLEFQSDCTTFSGFALDARTDPELLSGGPGLGPRGMFSLNELTLEYQEPGSTTFVPVPLTAPVARYGVPAGLVDGNPSTKWTVREKDVKSVYVILLPEKRLMIPPQTKLRLTLHQDTPLGLFRFRSTAGNAIGRVSELKKIIEQDNAPFALHVNLGGGSWRDPEKRLWTKSKAYARGSWGHEGGQPAATQASDNAPAFLKSALTGIRAFRADVPNGKYKVTLFFVAHGVKKAGDRVFSVQVETLAPAPVDLFRATNGGKNLFAPPTEVVVKDGRLDIVLKKIVGQPPILNAVSITE